MQLGVLLRRRGTKREPWPVPDRIAQIPEPFEGGVIDDGFVEEHSVYTIAGFVTSCSANSEAKR